MKDPVKEWLPQRVTLAGVLAASLRRPNGKITSQCADPACPPAAMDNLLRQLDGSRVLFAGENPQPKWLTYCFEQGQLRFVVRPDGWMFAMLVRPETDAAYQLDVFSEEFLLLPLVK